MKKYRKIACLFLALVMMLSLTACGSFEMKMATAAKKMEKLQSYRMDVDVDMERAKYWIANGAQPTDTVRGLLKKAEG